MVNIKAGFINMNEYIHKLRERERERERERFIDRKHKSLRNYYSNILGPVVQSIVSLTSSLRGQLVKCFWTLLPNILKFLLKKCEKLLHCKSFSHFFNKNIGIFEILTFEILTSR